MNDVWIDLQVTALGMYERQPYDSFCKAVHDAMEAASYDDEWGVMVIVNGLEIRFS